MILMINRRRERPGNQDPAELAEFLDLVVAERVRRYLEVGCRNGDTFYAVMRAIGPGGFGLAIDRPENADARASLEGAVDELCDGGIDARVLFGSSHDPAIVAAAARLAPFDLVLIDADHRYDALVQDWENYGTLARMIALHDVAAPDGHLSDGHRNDVGRFWRERKAGFRHREIVAPGSAMGFGIAFRTPGRSRGQA